MDTKVKCEAAYTAGTGCCWITWGTIKTINSGGTGGADAGGGSTRSKCLLIGKDHKLGLDSAH